MKRSSILIGIAIGAAAAVLLMAAFKLAGDSSGAAHPARPFWHGSFRSGHPLFLPSQQQGDTGFSKAWIVLLRIALLTAGAVLFLKAKGIWRWAGAALAALCTISLLTPLWGTIALILAVYLYRRAARNRTYTSPQALTGFPSSAETASSRGRFLDEWERNQHKEE